MNRYVRVFDRPPVAESFRMRLAMQLEAEGICTRRAETLLLRNGKSENQFPQLMRQSAWSNCGKMWASSTMRLANGRLWTTYAQTRCPLME